MIDIAKLAALAIGYDAGDPRRVQHLMKVYAFSRLIGQREKLDEQEQKGTLTDVYSHTLLNMILLTIVRKISLPVKAEKRGRVEDVISYIHTHYQEDITLDSLAGQFYVSPYYLCREFKKYTNSTIIQYLNVTRIMNAQRKFMETDGNITEISKATGFSNITHFNRVFKAVTGMTPSSYRKLLQTAEAGTNTGSDPKE